MKENPVRKEIIEILSGDIYSDRDYSGRFFTNYRNSFTVNKFSKLPNTIFKGKMAVFDEAVDKMGYWSSLLHCFFNTMYLHQLTLEDVFGFVLFFCHQCNTTEIIVQATMDLLEQNTSIDNNVPLYFKLKNECEKYNKIKNNYDVGSGGSYARFGTSSNNVYDTPQYQSSINIITKAVALSWELFNNNRKKLTMEVMFELFSKVQSTIETMDGFGPLRSSHTIQLLSLIGVIPLQYYVYLPIHMSGGPGNFIKKLNWTKKNMHKKCTEEISTLQKIYGCNFTPNMFENMSCILGRTKKRKDIFYYLPSIVGNQDGSNKLSETQDIQFTFRIKISNINNIFMTCKSSTYAKEEIVMSSTSSSKSKSIVSYDVPLSLKDIDQHNLQNKNHHLDTSWFESQSTVLEISDKMNQLQIKHINIPPFESLYNNDQIIYGYDSWNLYSMIHSTPNEKFNFIVYSGSHKLKTNQAINPKSRIEIAFPSDSDYLIIFHGRLVHSGASSIPIIELPNQVWKSTRLFSYLRVPEQNNFHQKTRKSNRLTSYVENQYQGTFDTASFSFPTTYIEPTTNKINLPSYSHNTYKKFQQHKTLIPVAGNMINDGWEVYHGIDFTTDYVSDFTNQMNTLVSKHKHKFNGISGSKRRMLELSSLDSLQNKSISKLNHLYRGYETILRKRLMKISYLEEVEMDNKAVLFNAAAVCEQVPHRDYSSVKINK